MFSKRSRRLEEEAKRKVEQEFKEFEKAKRRRVLSSLNSSK